MKSGTNYCGLVDSVWFVGPIYMALGLIPLGPAPRRSLNGDSRSNAIGRPTRTIRLPDHTSIAVEPSRSIASAIQHAKLNPSGYEHLDRVTP